MDIESQICCFQLPSLANGLLVLKWPFPSEIENQYADPRRSAFIRSPIDLNGTNHKNKQTKYIKSISSARSQPH